ncbi:MAG: alpha-glucosidase/alpha-galactosidase [Oscillospiraceae bacterium]|nr:alpha-glucosidase/alpha-galactosidase [Oscillospiraceae bacterium]
MKHYGDRVEELTITYIGGGSRSWAWTLMSDLARAKDLSGTVRLYDIDPQAAFKNQVIGNSIPHNFRYEACEDLAEALKGADFVVISILPGTFDEMESDVHWPERYGIWQSVGDTTGPGGIVRALRTVPMFETFARAIRENCPEAWVINYTNPMTVCVRTLYKVFPGIRAFGCCHEVFGSQALLGRVYTEAFGGELVSRQEVKVNVLGLNHFTWITSASCRGRDLFPAYRAFNEKLLSEPAKPILRDEHFSYFASQDRVKSDTFLRYGCMGAAGDRHLAEFSRGEWYLKNPETAESWGFTLTPVSYRRADRAEKLALSEAYYTGKTPFEFKDSGEEGVDQMRALLGLGDMVTNVNLPNRGQIPNLPADAVVETNASFTASCLQPVMAGNVPASILPQIAQVCAIQEAVAEAALRRDLDAAFCAFASDPLVTISAWDARKLFDEMVDNTAAYLKDYRR